MRALSRLQSPINFSMPAGSALLFVLHDMRGRQVSHESFLTRVSFHIHSGFLMVSRDVCGIAALSRCAARIALRDVFGFDCYSMYKTDGHMFVSRVEPWFGSSQQRMFSGRLFRSTAPVRRIGAVSLKRASRWRIDSPLVLCDRLTTFARRAMVGRRSPRLAVGRGTAAVD